MHSLSSFSKHNSSRKKKKTELRKLTKLNYDYFQHFVLSHCLNVSRDGKEVMSNGKLFHIHVDRQTERDAERQTDTERDTDRQSEREMRRDQ